MYVTVETNYFIYDQPFAFPIKCSSQNVSTEIIPEKKLTLLIPLLRPDAFRFGAK